MPFLFNIFKWMFHPVNYAFGRMILDAHYNSEQFLINLKKYFSFAVKLRLPLAVIVLLIHAAGWAQTKVAGIVTDEKGRPMPYVNIVFKGSVKGTITDEEGRFYLASDKTYHTLVVAFMGYKTKEIPIKSRQLNLRIRLEPEAQNLETVTVALGKPRNKGNPAIALLKKVRARKHRNGLNGVDYYQYDKYEKIEFDLYLPDTNYTLKRLPKDFRFIGRYVDTSAITGRPMLPAFINESYYKVYGRNLPPPRKREDLIATKASGVNNSEFTNVYLKDIYADYDVYSPFIRVFDKKFVSPLSPLAPLTYYFVLADTAEIDGIRSFNIIFYPRRSGDLAFKGDMWVADSLYAVQDIALRVSRKANVNWIKDFYLEQSYYLYNDSVYLPKRYFVMTELGAEEIKSIDLLVKKTTVYRNYVINRPLPDKFYRHEKSIYDKDIYTKPDTFWTRLRPERLNPREEGVYQMLDSLRRTKTFRRLSKWASAIGSGYWEIPRWHFDFGPIFSVVGYNDVEGLRIRLGGRTYFQTNDLVRFEGFTAYGFMDRRFKYGLSAKAVVSVKPRLMLAAGYRHDIEQTGVSLTALEEDELNRNLSASFVFSTGDKTKLTDLRLAQAGVSFEPRKNVALKIGGQFKDMRSAHPAFRMDYYDHNGQIRSVLRQPEVYAQIKITPGRKLVGYGVKRYEVNSNYPVFLVRYTRGFSRGKPDAFNYAKWQFYFDKRFLIGGVGKSIVQVETGFLDGTVPLGLLNVVPGNQSYFYVGSAFQLLNYYEFITDRYVAVKWMHNFEGRILDKIPLIKRLKWRTIIFANGVWGRISPANRAVNASGMTYLAPEKPYLEYGVGITNIKKFLEFDAFWRADYRGPDRQNFGLKMNVRLDF